MNSLKKLNILTPLQKLPKNVGDLGKLIVAKGFEKLPKSPNLVTPVERSKPILLLFFHKKRQQQQQSLKGVRKETIEKNLGRQVGGSGSLFVRLSGVRTLFLVFTFRAKLKKRAIRKEVETQQQNVKLSKTDYDDDDDERFVFVLKRKHIFSGANKHLLR